MKNIIFLMCLFFTSCVVEQRKGLVIDKIEEVDIYTIGYGSYSSNMSGVNFSSGKLRKSYSSILKDIDNGTIHKLSQNLEDSYLSNIGDTLTYKLYHFRWSENGKRVRNYNSSNNGE